MAIWKKIEGHSRYEVSDTGEVRRTEDGSLLEGGLSSQGYVKVHLTDDTGRKADHNVHMLMARAFYGEIPGARIVHLNGHKTDNRLGNLRSIVSDPVQAQQAFQRNLARRQEAPTQ